MASVEVVWWETNSYRSTKIAAARIARGETNGI